MAALNGCLRKSPSISAFFESSITIEDCDLFPFVHVPPSCFAMNIRSYQTMIHTNAFWIEFQIWKAFSIEYASPLNLLP